MNRFSFIAIAGLLVAAGLLLEPMFTEPPTDIVESIPEPRTERIVDLPEDGDLWQLIIIYTDSNRTSEADRRLASMLATTPRLQSLIAQTKVYEFSPEHFWVKQNLSGKALPALVLQAVEPAPNNKKGKPIYSVSRDNMPADGELMASEIQATIEQLYPQVRAKRLNRDCPNCTPNRDPRRPNPLGPRIPDIRPTVGQPGQRGDLTLILLLLGGSAAAAYFSAKK